MRMLLDNPSEGTSRRNLRLWYVKDVIPQLSSCAIVTCCCGEELEPKLFSSVMNESTASRSDLYLDTSLLLPPTRGDDGPD